MQTRHGTTRYIVLAMLLAALSIGGTGCAVARAAGYTADPTPALAMRADSGTPGATAAPMHTIEIVLENRTNGTARLAFVNAGKTIATSVQLPAYETKLVRLTLRSDSEALYAVTNILGDRNRATRSEEISPADHLMFIVDHNGTTWLTAPPGAYARARSSGYASLR